MAETDTNWVHFTRTQWTLVLSAKSAPPHDRLEALESLCRSYWPPIYAYIRQNGYRPADAQDLTQEFFARLLEKDFLQHLTHQRGKFRSFLLTFVNHMLSDERDKQRAKKRGGDQTQISLEQFASWEAELIPRNPTNNLETTFDRNWAHTVLKRASELLEADYASRGKAALFRELEDFASLEGPQPAYDDLAAKLGTTAQALRAAVHRMRAKFGRMIRDEVRHTIDQPEELEEEIRYLINVVSRP